MCLIRSKIYGVTVFCGLLAAANVGRAQTWAQTGAPTNSWASIVSSADGHELAALAFQCCYTSTNSGATWASNSFPASGSVLAAAADGKHLVSAQSNTGEIDLSTNGGLTWAKSTNYSEAAWYSLASRRMGKSWC